METKVLAIDYGIARIGLAISDNTKTLAIGLRTIKNKNTEFVFSTLLDLIHEHTISTIVIGNPLDQHGNPTPMSDIIKKFSDALQDTLRKNTIDVQCISWNETLTSYEAYENLLEKGKHHQEMKGLVDMEAARIILQEYLDNKEGK